MASGQREKGILHVRCRRPGRRGERGAVLVEAAFVLPVLLILILALMDGAYLIYSRLSVSNMSLSGARNGSTQGNDALADFYVLKAVSRGSGGVPASDIRTVVVYKATDPGTPVPAGCKTASVSGTCNRYVGADLAKAVDGFGCTGTPTKIDSSWCPTARKVALSGSGGPPDYLGVYVEVVRAELTGIFGRSSTLSATSVIRLEPRTKT